MLLLHTTAMVWTAAHYSLKNIQKQLLPVLRPVFHGGCRVVLGVVKSCAFSYQTKTDDTLALMTPNLLLMGTQTYASLPPKRAFWGCSVGLNQLQLFHLEIEWNPATVFCFLLVRQQKKQFHLDDLRHGTCVEGSSFSTRCECVCNVQRTRCEAIQ